MTGYSSRTGLGKVFRQSAQNLTKLAHVVKPQAFVWGKSLGAEIAALCERGDAIGGAIGQRLNGQSRGRKSRGCCHRKEINSLHRGCGDPD
jgi:hypothetical protein